MIFFNNGAHSSDVELPGEERKAAYENTVDYIMAKFPDTPLALVLCTPSRDINLNDMFKRFNDFTCEVATKRCLQIIDLFTPMEATDKTVSMSDHVHWTPEYSKAQGEIIAEAALKTISPKSKNLVLPDLKAH